MFKNVLAAVIALFLIVPHTNAVRGQDDWRAKVESTFNQHCYDCHQGDDAEGGLNLDSLSRDLTDLDSLRHWITIFDRVESGEMPPPDASVLAESEQSDFLKTLAAELTHSAMANNDVVLRRLNRVEYENTVRDLFHANVRVAQLLPKDNSTAGFDNVGEGLALSAEAMQAYLSAADAVLDSVFGPASPPDYVVHETNLLDQKEWDGKPSDRQIGKMFRRTNDGLVIFQSGYCPTNLLNFSRLRVPAGTYRGTFRVRAVQSDQPVTLRIYAGDTIVGRREKHLVGYYDIPPGEWTTITFEDRLVEPGGTFQPKCYGTRDTRKDADTYPEPGIEIGDITIEGPLEEWPPPSRKFLLGDVELLDGNLDDIRTIMRRTVPRAYRRDARAGEVDSLVKLAEHALAEGRSFESALRLSLKAMLCSPSFLFMEESDQPALDAFSLANRLSYFLWSSMPDDELTELARRGNLAEPETLREQVERMLADPKAEALTENFLGQWLKLRDIDFTTPDAMLYPDFDELLRISMLEETQRFFEVLVEQDLSLMNFVDSDFTFLNQRLAEHYDIPNVQGQVFRKVALPQDSVRGGVLTQASVLKVTANGTTTSPVIRGVWVLENLLGVKVPPPPSNVSAVEPDIRGATTLREQLAQHRDDDSCSVCHRKIDPAGFALENFDVIGGWRENYRTLGDGPRPEFGQDPHTFAWIRYRIGPAVDATGVTEDGRAFNDIREFKEMLVKDESRISNAVTSRLATYALGRQLTFADRDEIEAIVKRVSDRGLGMRTLIHEIVQSELFRKP